MVYMCSAEYAPGREHGVNPLCATIAIPYPKVGRDGQPLELLLSPKDTDAPGLNEAAKAGLLPPRAEACQVHRLVGLAHGFASFRGCYHVSK